MPRPATGELLRKVDRATGRTVFGVRFTDPATGSRTPIWFDRDEFGIPETEAAARAIIASIASERKQGKIVATPGETVAEWVGRYLDKCELEGQRTVSDRRGHFRNWIAPVIGTKSVKTLTSDDLRPVVRKLDDAVLLRARFVVGKAPRASDGRKPGLSAKTAQNIWAFLKTALDEAMRSKDDGLRVRTDNPSKDVRGPETGTEREQTALYSDELIKLLDCRAVPIMRVVTYAVAVFFGCRQGELRGLTADDVDFVHGVLRVRRQIRKGKASTTKTDAGIREVPIHAHILPLMQALVRARPKGPLLTMPAKTTCARRLQSDLRTAGLTRAELYADDGHWQPLNFHGLRHTAITHFSVAGHSTAWLLSAAGHTDPEMTARYLAKGASVRSTFGQPHPPLPVSVLERLGSFPGFGIVSKNWTPGNPGKGANESSATSNGPGGVTVDARGDARSDMVHGTCHASSR